MRSNRFHINYVIYKFRSAWFVLWLTARTVYAQNQESAFGEISPFKLGRNYDDIALVSTSDSVITFIAWVNNEKIATIHFNNNLTNFKLVEKHIDFSADKIIPAYLNKNKTIDLLAINKTSKAVYIILDFPKDSVIIKNEILLTFSPENIITGDINNDGNIDILLYTKNEAGIYPLFGNGRGNFTPGKTIAENNAVGSATLTHINNDRISDLVMVDWVKNELNILYGFGRGRFIEQSVFPLSKETAELHSTSIFHKYTTDFLLQTSDSLELQIWKGDGFGDFKFDHEINFDTKINDFTVCDVNRDGLKDIIAILNNGALQVIFNDPTTPFIERIEYAAGEMPKRIFMVPHQSGNAPNCIVFDKAKSQLIVFRNIFNERFIEEPFQMATGRQPTQIITQDFNRDGIADIALINTSSKSLSLFYGQKKKIPKGPYSVQLKYEPSNLAFHSLTDTTINFVISFSNENKLSFLTLDIANATVNNAFIETDRNAQILSTSTDKHGYSKFFTFNYNTRGNSISFYEQLSHNIFIEQTFRPASKNPLLGATIADLNNDKFPDIVYIYRNGSTAKTEFGVAFGDSSYSMKLRLISKEFNLPEATGFYIWAADFDKDKNPDLLIYADMPAETFYLMKGKGDGLFYSPKELTRVKIDSRSSVQIVDVDRDNLIDIAIGLNKKGKVIYLRNEGNCNFTKPYTLIKEHDFENFKISNIDGDSFNDLILTDRDGFLRIYPGKNLNLKNE